MEHLLVYVQGALLHVPINSSRQESCQGEWGWIRSTEFEIWSIAAFPIPSLASADRPSTIKPCQGPKQKTMQCESQFTDSVELWDVRRGLGSGWMVWWSFSSACAPIRYLAIPMRSAGYGSIQSRRPSRIRRRASRLDISPWNPGSGWCGKSEVSNLKSSGRCMYACRVQINPPSSYTNCTVVAPCQFSNHLSSALLLEFVPCRGLIAFGLVDGPRVCYSTCIPFFNPLSQPSLPNCCVDPVCWLGMLRQE